MNKANKKPITSIYVGRQLNYLCKRNNRQKKTYNVDERDFSELLLDMYESQYKIFDYPDDCISKQEKAYERSKKQKIIAKHLDNTQGIGLDWIKYYCDFFGCSADYLLGLIDKPTHRTTDVYKKTGLSHEAASKLLQADKDTQLLYDRLISGDYINTLVSVLNTFYDFGVSVEIKGKRITDQETYSLYEKAIKNSKVDMLRKAAADSIQELAYDEVIAKHFTNSRLDLYNDKVKDLLKDNPLALAAHEQTFEGFKNEINAFIDMQYK